MKRFKRTLHIFIMCCLIISLSMNAVFFIGFWSETFKVRKTVSVEALKPFLGSELESELVFDRFAVATQKNDKTTPDFDIADARFEDIHFIGQSINEGQQYEFSLHLGEEFSQTLVVSTANPPKVQEMWYTYNEKTKMDLNVDGSPDMLLNLEKRKVYIKVNKNWTPVKPKKGSEFKRQTIDGHTYRFEHSSGKWVPATSKESES